MSGSEGYLWQGRQEPGWFGHGTKPRDLKDKDAAAGVAASDSLEARLNSVIYGAVAAMPKRERAWVEARMGGTQAVSRLRGAMLAWGGADRLDRAAFRSQFLPASTSNAAVDLLRLATISARQARTYADLRVGGELLAAAIREVGTYRWPEVMAEAGRRAGTALIVPVADRKPASAAPIAPGKSPFTADGSMPDLTPVPLLDDQGRPVQGMDDKGNMVDLQRPAGVDPHFFVNRGHQFNAVTGHGLAIILFDLRKFGQGRSWDIQRLAAM